MVIVVDADEAGQLVMAAEQVNAEAITFMAMTAITTGALADPASGATDFTRPGHVFPVDHTAGGVIAEPGHAEAAVDPARLAGLAPVGCICEICDGCELATHAAGGDSCQALDTYDRLTVRAVLAQLGVPAAPPPSI